MVKNNTVPAAGPAHFDQAAATWDVNPTRRAMSAAIAAAIDATVPLTPTWTALEYGCGTATLGFLLAPRLRSVVAADSSPGMLDQVRQKAAAGGVRNLQPRLLDLTQGTPAGESFDFIFSAMTLHHVDNLAALTASFARLLAPGGWLALADLCPEDGSFHPDTVVPHHGVDPAELGRQLAGAGLRTVAWRPVHELERHGRRYPIFLLTAHHAFSG
ncbi:MAG: class I SAM-dependent methyltransferase [Lentisphaeria bacterium]